MPAIQAETHSHKGFAATGRPYGQLNRFKTPCCAGNRGFFFAEI